MILRHRILHRPATVLLAAMLGCPFAMANSEDNLQFSARHEIFYDNNLFRRTPSRQSTTESSDTINTTTLGISYDKRYSLQRVEVEANLVKRQYQNFNYLDFSALDYRTAWHWSATPRFRGVFSADRRTRPNNSAGVSNTNQRNLRSDDTLSFNGELDLGAAVRLVGGLGQRRQSNEQVILQDRDSRTRTVRGGLRYEYPSGNDVGYLFKVSRGGYLNRPEGSTLTPNDFEQTEHEIAANWTLSAKSSLRGSLSYLSRRHFEMPQRDFSTPLAKVLFRWTPTGKLAIDAELERDVLVTHTDYASYVPENRFSLRPTWNASAQMSLRMQLEYLDQGYQGSPSASALYTGRDDTTRLARLALDWRPQDALLVTLQVQTEKRSSNFSNFDYKTHGASLAARLRF